MPYRAGDPTKEVEGVIEHTSAKAYLIAPTMGAKKEVWLPKSQVIQMTEPDEDGLRVFTVTEWWYGVSGLEIKEENKGFDNPRDMDDDIPF